MSVISNAGRNYWAAANPETNTVLVFNDAQLVRGALPVPLAAKNFGKKLVMSEDVSG